MQNPSNLNTLNPSGKLTPQKVDSQGAELVTTGGVSTGFLSVTGALKASSGRLCSIVVTTVTSAAITIYDNASAASGNILFVIPAAAAVGTIYKPDIAAVNGIYASFAGTGSLAIGYN